MEYCICIILDFLPLSLEINFMFIHLNMFLPENSLGIPIYLLMIRVLFQFGLIF